jgi:hemoglobin
MRHLRFSIGPDEAGEWMRCMKAALAETGVAEPLCGYLEARFTELAGHMRNRGID